MVKLNVEPPPGLRSRPDLATVQADDPTGQGEAEAGAGRAALPRAAVELLEDLLLLALGDPDAVVGHLDAHPARLRVVVGGERTHGDWSAGVYLIALPTRLSSSWRSRPGSASTLCGRSRKNWGSAPSSQLELRLSTISLVTSSELHGVGAQLAVLDHGVVQPVLDHLAHALGGLTGLGHGVADDVLVRVLVLGHLEPAVHHGERTAEVVGDHAGEVAQLAQPGSLGGDVVEQEHPGGVGGGADVGGVEVEDPGGAVVADEHLEAGGVGGAARGRSASHAGRSRRAGPPSGALRSKVSTQESGRPAGIGRPSS